MPNQQSPSPNQMATQDIQGLNNTIDAQGLKFNSDDDQMAQVNSAIDVADQMDSLKMGLMSSLFGALDPLNCISADAVDDHDQGAQMKNAANLIKKGAEFVAENPEILGLALA